jgi:hypothetical protein
MTRSRQRLRPVHAIGGCTMAVDAYILATNFFPSIHFNEQRRNEQSIHHH